MDRLIYDSRGWESISSLLATQYMSRGLLSIGDVQHGRGQVVSSDFSARMSNAYERRNASVFVVYQTA